MNESSSRPDPHYDVNSSAPPLDLISHAQDNVVKFAKAFADTVYYAQQMQPEELDTPTAGSSSSSSSSSEMVDERNVGVGVAKILNLGANLSRDFEEMVNSIQQVPDYAAAYSNDEAYEKRLLSITKDERDGPRETLRRGIEAGRKRLKNIDAVLCAAARYALNEPLHGVAGSNEDLIDDDDDDDRNIDGDGLKDKTEDDIVMETVGEGGKGGSVDKKTASRNESHFDRLQIVGPDHDKPFIR